LKTPFVGHQLDLYDHLLSPLSEELPPAPSALLRVPVHLQHELDRHLTALGLEIDTAPWIIAPSAAYGTAKQWPLDRFAGVIRGLLEAFPQRSVLCLGGPADRDLIQTMLKGLGSPRIHNLAGSLPLNLSLALVSRAAGVLANDSGLMHAAWALDVPLVTVFGPNDPLVSGPRSAKARVLYKKALCSPCPHRHCPIDHRCMTAISVAETLDAMLGLAELEPKG
jgi:heptosyltransferase-2